MHNYASDHNQMEATSLEFVGQSAERRDAFLRIDSPFDKLPIALWAPESSQFDQHGMALTNC